MRIFFAFISSQTDCKKKKISNMPKYYNNNNNNKKKTTYHLNSYKQSPTLTLTPFHSNPGFSLFSSYFFSSFLPVLICVCTSVRSSLPCTYINFLIFYYSWCMYVAVHTYIHRYMYIYSMFLCNVCCNMMCFFFYFCLTKNISN